MPLRKEVCRPYGTKTSGPNKTTCSSSDPKTRPEPKATCGWNAKFSDRQTLVWKQTVRRCLFGRSVHHPRYRTVKLPFIDTRGNIYFNDEPDFMPTKVFCLHSKRVQRPLMKFTPLHNDVIRFRIEWWVMIIEWCSNLLSRFYCRFLAFLFMWLLLRRNQCYS